METPYWIVLAAESLARVNLREAVMSLGHKIVGEANNAQTTVRSAYDLRPDLLIIDLNMSGFEDLLSVRCVAEALLAPVLLLTTLAQCNGADQAGVGEAVSYLACPFSEDELAAAITAALANSVVVRTRPPPSGTGKPVHMIVEAMLLSSFAR